MTRPRTTWVSVKLMPDDLAHLTTIADHMAGRYGHAANRSAALRWAIRELAASIEKWRVPQNGKPPKGA